MRSKSNDYLFRSDTKLRPIILSHGWYALPPFIVTIQPPSLKVTFESPHGAGSFRVYETANKRRINIYEGKEGTCRHVAEQCLAQDVQTNDLYSLISSKMPEWMWVSRRKLGKFLRSPSLFEDCCKAILTTNTSWDRTILMVTRLVDSYGRVIGSGKAFPTPQKIADGKEDRLRRLIGCGFRGRYILDLCRNALKSPGIFLGQAWRRLDHKEFYASLLSIKGIGESSANYLSMIYWKPNGFVMDAYVRRRCNELWGVAENNLIAFLVKRYSQFGNFAPIVFWFDITKHWHVASHTSYLGW